MKVKQIADILNNTINKEQLGETAVVNEDLSNIVDVGRKLEANGVFGDNFDNFVKKLIDRIGKTIYVDRTYKSQAPDILRDGWEYGSALQKVRCDLPEAEENKTWSLADLANGTSVDPFIINKPNVSAKYFNSKTTFEIPITLAEEQVKEAFTSAENINRFFSMIENRILVKKTLCTDSMIMRTIDNLIANKVNAGKNVINLLSSYNSATSSTLTAEQALSNESFLRYSTKTIMLYKKYMNNASTLYNNDGYVTYTPDEDLKIVMLSDFAKSLEVNLYDANGVYNTEFLKLTGYSEVPFWQGSGTDNSFTSHSTINISAVDDNGSSFTVNQPGVLCTMFDINGCMICNQNDRTTSIYNPKGEYWNYFYKFDCMYMNDLAENCVVFTVADKVETTQAKARK